MRQQQKAFTLIELLVTISVVGIVAFMALPSFNQMITDNKSVSVANSFAEALKYARSQAMTATYFVTVCPQNNTGDGCGTDWNKGWIVVKDTAVSDAAAAPVVDAILRKWDAPDTSTVFTFTPARTFVRFARLGVLGRDLGMANVLLNIDITHSSCNAARNITIELSGIVKVETPTNCNGT